MASVSLAAFPATISARSSDMRPAIGISTSAICLPFETMTTPPPFSARMFAAIAISALFVPTTIMWCESCATVEAMAQSS
jgi:hypothetical protein